MRLKMGKLSHALISSKINILSRLRFATENEGWCVCVGGEVGVVPSISADELNYDLELIYRVIINGRWSSTLIQKCNTTIYL